MRAVLTLAAIAVAAGAVGTAMPATAQAMGNPFTISGEGSNSATQTAVGAARTWSYVSNGENLSVKVTGWSIKPDGTIAQGAVGVWDTGMGVRWGSESSSSPDHTVDDIDGRDFLVFQFSKSVQMTGATFNPFNTTTGYDTDAVVRWGSLSGAWDGDVGLTGDSVSDLTSLMPGRFVSEDTRSSRTSGEVSRGFTTGAYGNLWMIAAQTVNDTNYDAFKLSQIKIFTPPPPGVPEPATWGMMILGFGAIGSAMRRKRRIEAGAATAA